MADVDVAIVRAAHLHVFLNVLREIGVDVESRLAASRLPGWLQDSPDAYLSLPLVLGWLGKNGRDVPPMELGYMAGRRASLAALARPVQTAIVTAPTLLGRLEALIRLAGHENSVVETRLLREPDGVRVICDQPTLRGHPFLCFAEWLNLQAIGTVVRSAAGPGWNPVEMTFASRYPPSEEAWAAFPQARILVGQPHTSILIEAELLALPCTPIANPAEVQGEINRWTLPSLLSSIITPYLGDGYPDIDLASELAGTSRRTLQRKLRQAGRTYSDVVKEARFALARRLLGDEGTKIVEVAALAGYETPQHFSRAFLRYTGMTPSSYRRRAAEGTS